MLSGTPSLGESGGEGGWLRKGTDVWFFLSLDEYVLWRFFTGVQRDEAGAVYA